MEDLGFRIRTWEYPSGVWHAELDGYERLEAIANTEDKAEQKVIASRQKLETDHRERVANLKARDKAYWRYIEYKGQPK